MTKRRAGFREGRNAVELESARSQVDPPVKTSLGNLSEDWRHVGRRGAPGGLRDGHFDSMALPDI